MAAVEMMQPINGVANELYSKGIFDSVDAINMKPTVGTVGHLDNSSDSAESEDGCFDTTILPDTPNLYKKSGVFMREGYFIFPRSVSKDKRYKGARLKYQKVLHILLEKAAFQPTTQGSATEIVQVSVGQYYVAIRQLVKLCNEEVKFKEDMVDKNIVERAIRFWEKCNFVRQEVRHGKSLITITVPEFYKPKENESETGSETKPRHDRDTKEEREEKEEEKKDSLSSSKYKSNNTYSQKDVAFAPSSLATSLLTDFYSSLSFAIPDFPEEKKKKTKTQYQAAERILKRYTPEVVKSAILFAHKPGGFWIGHVHSVSYLEKKMVTLLQQMKAPAFQNTAPQKQSQHNNPDFNKDHGPVQYVNKLSFKNVKPKENQ